MGSALAQALTRAGYPVAAILSRTASSAQRLAGAVDAIGLTSPENLDNAVDTVFICVPDDALPGVAMRLAGSRPSWRDAVVAHTSGMLDSGVLAPFASRGAEVMSFHPVQSFAPLPLEHDSGTKPFSGITITLEGATAAVRRGTELAEALGARPVQISVPQKRAIHAAASIGSNFLVTLAALAVDLGTRAEIPQAEMLDILRPLIAGTSRNLSVVDPESALTGPIVRGDADTIRLHLQFLHEYAPDLETLYRGLARATLKLAARSGRVSPDRAAQIAELLNIGTIST